MTEYKYTDLRALKMEESGPGTISGLRATFDVDEGGDLIVKGAFRDTIKEFLAAGFTAQSHQWGFSEAIGFPLEAYETERGFFVKSQFHSTPDAQLVRTKAKERMKAGKRVGFSFGYAPQDYEFIQARDYEKELPRYVSSDLVDYNLAQAKKFPQIRLLRKLEVIEDSIVTAPMNKRAMAADVKGGRYRSGVYSFSRGRSLQLRLQCLKALYGPGEQLSGTDALKLRVEALQLQHECFQALHGPGRIGDNDRLRIESVRLRAGALASLAG